MHRTVVLDVVGLSADLVGDATPNVAALARAGAMRPLRTNLPAVTCPVQSTFATGTPPRDHGAVANGWYFRDLSEVWLWRQSDRLVAGERIWEAAARRDPRFTSAKLFWWYNMYGTATYSVTPRPIYLADGRKLPDVYTEPAELRDELTERLGVFPLFSFWGPGADIVSRDPAIRRDRAAVDALAGEIIDHVRRDGARVIVLSEYAMGEVRGPVHVNRVLRDANLLRVRTERGHELLAPGASEAFAVSDHQVAHMYVRRPERVAEVKALLEAVPGVETVLDADGKARHGLDHHRSGELVAVAAADRWFTYYYWLDDDQGPAAESTGTARR